LKVERPKIVWLRERSLGWKVQENLKEVDGARKPQGKKRDLL
jgi:hypothetical protein